MSSIQFTQTAYGLSQALINVFPVPIVSPSANPTTSNFAQIGTVWINKSANAAFILTSIVSNSANWINLVGGAGVFTSLTVNPGPTNLSTVGNGAVTIGNSSNTAAVTINSGSGGVAVNGNGNSISFGSDAAANTVSVGSATGGAGTTILGGVNGITLATSTSGSAFIQLGLATMTGPIIVGASTAGQRIDIGNAINTGSQTINIASGNGAANSIVNVLNGVMTAGAPTFSLMASGGRAGFVNIANGAVANTVIIGSTNTTAGTTIQSGTSGLSLKGAIYISVTNVSTTPYVLLGTDQYLAVDTTGSAITVTLPAVPAAIGRYLIICDAKGNAGANAITVNGNGINISVSGVSAATATIAANYASLNLFFNGTIWNGQYVL